MKESVYTYFTLLFNRICLWVLVGIAFLFPFYIKTAYDFEDINCIASAARKAVTKTLFDVSARGDIKRALRAIHKGAVVNAQDADGYTALMLATLKGRRRMVRVLLGCNANIDIQNGHGDTALIMAVRARLTDMVRYLLLRGAHTDSENVRGSTALMLASLNEDSEVVRLLGEHRADMNIQSESGCTPLIRAVGAGRIDGVRLLLQHKADVNFQNKFGNTALMHVFKENPIDMIHLLLEYKADINLQNKFGDTALHFMAFYPASAKILVLQGADVTIKNRFNETALEAASLKTTRFILDAFTQRPCLTKELDQQKGNIETLPLFRIVKRFIRSDSASLVCAYVDTHAPTDKHSVVYAKKHYMQSDKSLSKTSTSTYVSKVLRAPEEAVSRTAALRDNCSVVTTSRRDGRRNKDECLQEMSPAHQALLRKKLSYCFHDHKKKILS